MLPRENKYPGMIMELKWGKDLSDEELEKVNGGSNILPVDNPYKNNPDRDKRDKDKRPFG